MSNLRAQNSHITYTPERAALRLIRATESATPNHNICVYPQNKANGIVSHWWLIRTGWVGGEVGVDGTWTCTRDSTSQGRSRARLQDPTHMLSRTGDADWKSANGLTRTIELDKTEYPLIHRFRLNKPSIYFLVSMPIPSANFDGPHPLPPFDPRPSRPNLPLSFLELATVESLALRTRKASRYTLLWVSDVVGACGRRIHTTHQPRLVLQVRSSSELRRRVEM